MPARGLFRACAGEWAPQPAHAQTFSVLHDSTDSQGGIITQAPLLDRAGNLYDVAAYGGDGNNGYAFQLKNRHPGWIFNVLYKFQGGYDGSRPDSSPVFGPDGALYGATAQGGIGRCGNGESAACGTI